MTFTVKIADTELDIWNKILENSPQGTIFHTLEWLRTIEKQSNYDFYPLIGYKGEKIIGLMPLFCMKKYLNKFVFSPPPKMQVFYLGPVIENYDSFTQDKKEEYLTEFQKAIDNFIFTELKGNYVRIYSSPGLDDSRQFKSTGYNVTPLYTYILNLNKGIENIWNKVNYSLRKNIKKAESEGVTFCEGTENDLDSVYESIVNRLSQKNSKSIISKEYLFELFKVFYPKNLRLHVAKYEGRNVGAIFNLMFKDRVIGWVGLYKSEINLPVNDLLQWKSIEFANQQGYQYYEIIDANTITLNRFKSKFAPDLHVYYSSIKYNPVYMKFIIDSYYFLNKKGL